jgi:hypothetical protein
VTVGLDVRLPIGLLFTLIGLALAGYGLVSDPAIYQRSLGINVNLIWGSVLLAFGMIMLLLARRGISTRAPAEDPERSAPLAR